MPETFQDWVKTLLVIAAHMLGHTVYQAYNNGDSFLQTMHRLKRALCLIVIYIAIFFVVYNTWTSMTVPKELNTKLDSRTTDQALRTCNLSLRTCDHGLRIATQRNRALEKRDTVYMNNMAAAKRRLSECQADISGLMERRSEDWWAFLEAHDDPVWRAEMMAGMSEQMRNEIWVVGQEKKRERDGELGIGKIKV